MRIDNHVILWIGEHIRFSLGSDSTKLNSKRVSSLAIMFHSVVIAAAAIEKFATT